jgi:Fuc2NAc and GlcNAc transferase
VFEFFVFPIIFLVSYFGIEAFRKWTLKRNLYDIPNERSSHTAPTPRGGGLIIVGVSLISYSIYLIFYARTYVFWAYVAGAILIAAISWLDDLYTVSFVWRFCIHVIAALLAMFSIGYFREFYAPFAQQAFVNETIGFVFTFLWIVWLTNAYNFMDGIDGIAGTQAITAGLGCLIIGKIIGAESVGFYGGVIAFAGLGFTLQNWQPAKIFMGDVGSAFLGYTFAVLPLLADRDAGVAAENRRLLPLIALSLNWLFVFDTIYTFLRRVFNKERVWEAHRGHIYQKLVLKGFSHQTVTILYGIISGVTVLVTIGCITNQKFWEPILVFLLAFQAAGLLIFLHLSAEKPKLI